MPIFAKDTDKIINGIIAELSRNSAFSAFQPGQKLRALIDAISTELGEAYQVFDFNIATTLISGAKGKFLDSMGELYGVARKSADNVTVSAATETVKFFVEGSSTFGDINNGADILIPAGTTIQTTTAAARPTRYFVKANTTLPAGSSSVYVAVESQQKGEFAVAGENSLIVHDFTSYSNSASKALKVTNVKPITYVQQDESDNDFKYRIINTLTSNEAANSTALRLAALSVPGVANVIIKEFAYGSGSCEVIITSQSARVPNILVELVQQKIDQVKAMGSIAVVKSPREVGIELATTLTFANGVTDDVKAATRQRVIDNLKHFFDSSKLAASISTQQILQVILNTDSRIVQVGNAKQLFEYIYIYKPSFSSNETYRRKFPIQSNDTIQLKLDEKLLTEFSILNPIVIS